MRQLDGRADRPHAVVHLALRGHAEAAGRPRKRYQPVEVAREQDALDALPRGGQIEALPDTPASRGPSAETSVRGRSGSRGADPPRRLRAPESHQRGQLLAILGDLGVGARQVGARLLVQDALAGEVEVGDVAGFVLTARDVGGQGGRLDDAAAQLEQLLRALQLVERTLHRRRRGRRRPPTP